VQGDADDVVAPQGVIDWASRATRQPRLVMMRGVGHFFHGRLEELAATVREAVRDAVQGG
jgi:alpha/beta superfamily hydrolase